LGLETSPWQIHSCNYRLGNCTARCSKGCLLQVQCGLETAVWHSSMLVCQIWTEMRFSVLRAESCAGISCENGSDIVVPDDETDFWPISRCISVTVRDRA